MNTNTLTAPLSPAQKAWQTRLANKSRPVETSPKPTLNSFADVKALLHRALNALASVCDGAVSEDGRGFNGTDAHWGHQMAKSNYREWSTRATLLVAKMLRKYKVQLGCKSIDLDVILDLEKMEQLASMAQAIAPDRSLPEAGMPGRRLEVMPDGFYKLEFPYSPQIVDALKALPPKNRQWVGDKKYWLVNFNTNDLDGGASIVTFVKTCDLYKFEFVGESREMLRKRYAEAHAATKAAAVNKDLSVSTDSGIIIPNLNGELKPFQKAGVTYAIRTKRTFIADDMGLGKTLQALATFEHEGAFPALVTCRANLQPNWAREIAKFFPHRKCSMNPFDKEVDITIVSHHDLIQAQEDLARRGYKAVCGDECQDFKNAKAKRTKALQFIMDAKPEYRFLLSGTPLENRPSELPSGLRLLGRLDEDFGGYGRFVYRYCGATRTRFGLDTSGCTNAEELNQKLRSLCYIRRMKDQVLTELPPKTRTVIDVDISNRAEYNTAATVVAKRLSQLLSNFGEQRRETMAAVKTMDLEALLDFVEENYPKVSKGDILEWKQDGKREPVLDFIEGALGNKETAIENAETIMCMTQLMKIAAAGKVDAFIEWYDEVRESGQKVVVFARSVAIQKRLAQIPGAIWTRASKWKTTQDAVDAFGSTDCPLLVCSLQGDNSGLNGMQCATYVAFIEMDFKPSTMDQAEDRLNRMGQKSAVGCYYFHGRNTIDSDTWLLLLSKWEVMKKVLNGEAGTKATSISRDLARRLMAHRN
jgi:SNF2 family DNA or RNA helicase